MINVPTSSAVYEGPVAISDRENLNLSEGGKLLSDGVTYVRWKFGK